MFGAAFPNELYTNAGKYTGAAAYNLMVRHLHDIAGGAVVTAPSISDLENAEVGHLARKYMSTMNGVDGEYRTRLFHAIRDLTADSYGGWSQVTNIQAGGGLYAQRIVTRKHYDLDGAKHAALRPSASPRATPTDAHSDGGLTHGPGPARTPGRAASVAGFPNYLVRRPDSGRLTE